jgi:SAM-dependent methyltransferase
MLSGTGPLLFRRESDGLCYALDHARARPFFALEDLNIFLAAHALTPGNLEPVEASPGLVGPAMPCFQAQNADIKELLAYSKQADLIREVLAQACTGIGIEIGAGDRPTVVPFGVQVEYVDRFTLAEAASGSFVEHSDFSRFVDVAYLEAMDNLASIRDDSLDFVIACHVIEHVPDVVGAINRAMQKLKSGGRLILVVPHRDRTFDAGRSVTPLSHFVADSLGADSALEHALDYARHAKGAQDWKAEGQRMVAEAEDFHYHTFTPTSFRELLEYLANDNQSLRFDVLEAAEVIEFYVLLHREPETS